MKKLLTLLACFLIFQAIAINVEKAIAVAKHLLIEQNIAQDDVRSHISIIDIVQKEGVNICYIMNLGDNDGFVIVSASEFVPPIIGFSFDNEFQWHPAIQYYLDNFAEFVLLEEGAKEIPDIEITKQWKHYLCEDFTPNKVSADNVPPLITTRWNQNIFYNTYCPWDRAAPPSYDNRVPNGCVALCAAQLLNYYRHPESGDGGKTYTPYGYPQQSVFLNYHKYHWDAMTDRASAYTNEIAKLAYHIGVMVNMGYAPGGSGARLEDLTKTLSENFFYTEALYSGAYDSVSLKREIDELRPIIMSGQDKDGSGHAFLVDGYRYEQSIKFHFNWGWGGFSDGYYLLQKHDFDQGAVAYLDIHPVNNYPVQCQKLKRQTASQGYVTNGSTNKPYQKGPDCSWMIAAPKATRYSFSFSRLDTKENIDVITIYNGSTKESGVAATFSGTIIPTQNTVVYADSVLITFTSSNHTVNNDLFTGFLLNYNTDKPKQTCDAAKQLTAAAGYITDGSLPNENYAPWTNCTWNIAPNYCTGFFGIFHEFNLALGDFIDIYNATTNAFWRRYDRYSPPTIGEVFNIPFPKISIKFISDNFDEENGFKLQYFSILGVNDNSLLDNLSIYPNPASDFINIDFSSEWINQPINCRLLDVTGKDVYSIDIEYNGGSSHTKIPVTHLSKGFYFLQLTTPSGKANSKIIIN